MKKGFTLIELLATVMIVGILAAVALPQYTKAIERSRTAEPMQVWDHVKKMAIAELSTQVIPLTASVCNSWLKDAGIKNSNGTYHSKNFVYTVSACSPSQVQLTIVRSNSASGADPLYTLTGEVNKNGFVTRGTNLSCSNASGKLSTACDWFNN